MSPHLLSYDSDVGKYACDLTCPLTYYLGATAVGVEARYPGTNDDLFHCIEENTNPSLSRLTWQQRYRCRPETLNSAILNARAVEVIEALLNDGADHTEENFISTIWNNV